MKRFFRTGIWFSIVTLLVAANSTVLAATTTYDLTTDWSTVANPNGPWKYAADGVALPTHMNNVFGISGWNGWVGDGDLTWALVTELAPGGDAEVGDIVIHSSPFTTGAQGQATWTSPSAGIIDISGQAWDVAHNPDRDDAWLVLLNDTALASRGSIQDVVKNSAEADFANNVLFGQTLSGLVVAAGDEVTFQIHETQNNFGHFTGVSLSIDLTPVPVPAAIWLFGSTLLGLCGFVKKRAA